VLVLVLGGAGAGVAWLGTGSSLTPDVAPSATSEPSEPSAASESSEADPSAPTTTPDRTPRGGRVPKPPAATASACPDLTEEVPLRVVSFNIHFGIGPDGFDVRRLAATIRRWDADVVMLQEVDRFRRRSRHLDLPRVLGRLTGMEVAFGLNQDDGRRGLLGNATLSRYPIVRRGNTRLPHQAGAQPRGLLRTDIDVDGTTVSVFNTHLQNGIRSLRTRQLAAIRPLVRASPHPVVLGGDFNSGPRTSQMRLAGSLARDVWADVGRGPGFTAPGRVPRYRIDYVMYTQPLRAVRARVLPDVISDHRAVRADLVLTVAGDEVCVPELDGPVGGDGPGSRTRGGGAGGDR